MSSLEEIRERDRRFMARIAAEDPVVQRMLQESRASGREGNLTDEWDRHELLMIIDLFERMRPIEGAFTDEEVEWEPADD